MRSSLYVITLVGAICTVGPVLADDATSALAVKGKIVPGSCTPVLSNGGKVDYGTIQTTSLFRPSNSLGVKNITLSISCSDTGYVGLTATDNRIDSLPDNIEVAESFFSKVTIRNDSNGSKYLFGLGKTLENKLVGAFTIGVDIENTRMDGDGLLYKYVNYSTNNGYSWTHSNYNGFYHYTESLPYIFSFQGNSANGPIAFKNAEIPLVISTAILDARELSVTDKVTLDGNVTFSIVYL